MALTWMKTVCCISQTGVQSLMLSTCAVCRSKSFKDMPGPLSIPYYGTSWKYFPFIGELNHMHFDKAAEILNKKYGPIVKENVGSINMVHLFNPKDFETVYKLVHKPEKQLRMSFFNLKDFRDSKPNIYKNKGILPTYGKEWWEIRKLVQKPLSPVKESRNYLDQIDEIVTDFTSKLENVGKIDDFQSFAQRVNLNITLRILFGEKQSSFDKAPLLPTSLPAKLIENIGNFTDSVGYFDKAQFHWTKPSAKDYKKTKDEMDFFENFVTQLIEKAKNKNNIEDTCIAARMMKELGLDTQEILGTMIDLTYGGVDTTSITLTFLMYELSKDKRVQDLVIKESKQLLPKGKNSKVTSDTLNNATYVKACLKENFRLNPLISVHNRQLTEATELSGFKVPKNTLVLLQTYVACRQEKHFRDPLTFKPERWLKASKEYEEINPYIVLPFGIGVRSCIARRYSEQILAAFILRIFSEFNTKYDGEELGTVTPFLSKPDKPVKLKISNNF